MIGGNVTEYSVIDKEGKITNYVWCNKTRKMVIEKQMTETAVIYSNGSQECERIGMLLKALGGEFHEYKLGEHFDQKAFYKEFGAEATYPQVAYGSKHIGSMKETLHFLCAEGII
jgi:hypothetical protein